MFGGPVMGQFVILNGAIAVFWVALVIAFELGFEGITMLLLAIFAEILWIDLCWSVAKRTRDRDRRRPPSRG